MKLLLVDSEINYQSLVDARKDDVDYIVFDRQKYTFYKLFKEIRDKRTKYSDIALVQHAIAEPFLIILENSNWCHINEKHPYDSFNEFKGFLMKLKATVGVERFDMLGCALYHNVNFQKIVRYLEEETGIDLRASTNFTGNPRGTDALADWIMESDNVDIRENYFTEDISGFKDLLYIYYMGIYAPAPSKIGGVNTSVSVTANKNTIYSWGTSNGQYLAPRIVYSGTEAVNTIYYGIQQYFIKTAEGSLLSWNGLNVSNVFTTSAFQLTADFFYNGNHSYFPFADTVVSVVSNNFTSMIQTSSAVWTVGGSALYGGSGNQYLTYILEYGTNNFLPAFSSVCAGNFTFFGISFDGAVYTMGAAAAGGVTSSNTMAILKDVTGASLPKIKKIYPGWRCATLITETDTAYILGFGQYGGSLPSQTLTVGNQNICRVLNDSNGNQIINIVKVESTQVANALLTTSNTVYYWGYEYYGGSGLTDYTKPAYILRDASGNILNNIRDIKANQYAFVAITSTNNVYIWGNEFYGGSGRYDLNGDYSVVNAALLLKDSTGQIVSNVKTVYSNNGAFAALTYTGDVYIWGYESYGGSGRYERTSAVFTAAIRLVDENNNPITNIITIESTASSFAAIDSVGNVWAWGDSATGGSGNITYGLITAIKIVFIDQYDNTIAKASYIKGMNNVFLAVANNKVYTWGTYTSGGSVNTKIPTQITALNGKTFEYTSIFPLSAQISSTTGSSLRLNQATELNPNPSGGSGSYSYTWYELENNSDIPIGSQTHPYIVNNGQTLSINNNGQFPNMTKKKYKCVVHNL
jgi:alpha-tubulin suppressor-like RCC1 family protein